MQQSRMIGWWSPAAPVKTGHDNVLATTYVRAGGGKALLALASWAPGEADVKLTVDWKALGIDPLRARLRAPAIKDFQEEAIFAPTDVIRIPPGRGRVLVLEPRP